MTERIRILIVDDHQLVRAGLRTMLELEHDFEVVGEVGDPRQALASVNEIAVETASAVVSKLLGEDVSPAEAKKFLQPAAE